MTFEEFEKADVRKLRKHAMNGFDGAMLQHTHGDFKAASLLEAQFHLQEIDRRESTRIGRRDFWMEVVVIGLIGIEIILAIVLAIVASREQSRDVKEQLAAFGKMQDVLTNLQESSKATASTLTTLETTTETMNGALQKQLALFYDVSVTMLYEPDKHELHVMNDGRTNVSIWGLDVGDVPVTIGSEGRVLTPNGGYGTDGSAVYNFVLKRFPMPGDGLVPFKLYVKNERNEQFVVHGYFAMHWIEHVGHLNVQISTIVPENWGITRKKRP